MNVPLYSGRRASSMSSKKVSSTIALPKSLSLAVYGGPSGAEVFRKISTLSSVRSPCTIRHLCRISRPLEISTAKDRLWLQLMPDAEEPFERRKSEREPCSANSTTRESTTFSSKANVLSMPTVRQIFGCLCNGGGGGIFLSFLKKRLRHG